MRPRQLLLLTAWGAATLLCFSGCGSSPTTRFYSLVSLRNGESRSAIENAGHRRVIAVGPVELADYLSRSEIVERRDATRIVLFEFDQWAGSLQSNLARVLADNLAALLDPAGFLVLPWEETARFDGRIQIVVTRLESTGRGTVRVSALWTLFGREGGEILSVGQAVIHGPVEGGGTAGIVEAMSRSLLELSRRIAEDVKAELLPAADCSPQ
jgi:uncharacterized lipoprotein YmbA